MSTASRDSGRAPAAVDRVRIAPLFVRSGTVRVEGVVTDVRAVPSLPSDRPAWARVLQILGVVPIIVAGAMAVAIGIAMRVLLRGRGRGGGGAIRHLLRPGMLGGARGRRDGGERATLIELDGPDRHRSARMAVDPSDVPIRPGERVSVTGSGSSNGVLRGHRLEGGAVGVVRTPSLINGYVALGALVAVIVVLGGLGALAGA